MATAERHTGMGSTTAGRCALSICIVNWNNERLLRQLLESLAQASSEVDFEAIVVDNASSDGSADMVARDFPEVRLVRNAANLGFAKANNQAAALATGRILLFLNNDTIVRPGALRKLVDYLDSNPSCAAVGPMLIGSDGRPQRSCRGLPSFRALLHRVWMLRWVAPFRRAYRDYRWTGFHPESTGPALQIAGAALAVRREALELVGGWDERFEFGLEDTDLCVRLAQRGRLIYIHDAEIVHLGRISSRANRRFVYRGYECGYARYLRKHDARAWPVWTYKTLITLDLPLRVALLALRVGAQSITLRRRRMRASYEQLVATAGFLSGDLLRFWRS